MARKGKCSSHSEGSGRQKGNSGGKRYISLTERQENGMWMRGKMGSHPCGGCRFERKGETCRHEATSRRNVRIEVCENGMVLERSTSEEAQKEEKKQGKLKRSRSFDPSLPLQPSINTTSAQHTTPEKVGRSFLKCEKNPHRDHRAFEAVGTEQTA
ncbi:hypothetical protein P154DRAFT_49095 [Amniculicola lignicola CBS 123094]|uniref:Uncharacterized protein n=1 Tax=Amniculicola lignicola CBS 123094 TaxID=1392246 RepID=A0A6A5W418_9PLEO|nr:hypothetical protein P154DRAFT_49095 [Amniculicola lignicola CBS 123094]